MKGTAVIDRLAQVVVIVASVWFCFTAAWGMFGILGDGHLGAGNAGNAMCAEQIVRWKILYPAMDWYSGSAPPKTAYYCHHPFGQYYVDAFFIWILGHHDFVIRLPAVLLSSAIPPLLYGIAKERWGVPIGAVAAAAYVVVPIAVGFSGYLNLETVCIFGALLFFWGHSRHMTTGRRRYMVASLVGLIVACAGDWVGYLVVAPLMALSFLRLFVLPRRTNPGFEPERYTRWWVLSASIVIGTLVAWVALFYHADCVRDWLGSAIMRGGGETEPLRATLVARKAWIYFSFTPLAIWLGVVAAPVCLLRLVTTRRDEEAYALSVLFAAVIQYVTFKQGADVHIYWPHYFAPYFALSLAQLSRTIASSVAWVAQRFAAGRAPLVAAATGLVVGLMPSLAMAHDSVQSLWVWRRTGGRYDDNGALIESRVDELFVIQDVVMPKTKRGTGIDVHPSAEWYWDQTWKYQGVANTIIRPLAGSANVAAHPFWLARPRGLSSEEQKAIVASVHVRAYGDVWVVDQREPPAPIDAFSLNEREPNPFEWIFYGGTEPVRSISGLPDPWLTWEWRTHLGQPATPPEGDPVTLDEMRIAHNVAIATGNAAEARRWRDRIDAQLDHTKAIAFDRGVHLIGVRVTGGVEPRVESWFESVGSMGDATFNVRSTIEARASFSLIPPDATDREMYWGSPLPMKLWRAGMLYRASTVQNHRIGRERYWGYWVWRDGSSPPRRSDGKSETTLALVP